MGCCGAAVALLDGAAEGSGGRKPLSRRKVFQNTRTVRLGGGGGRRGSGSPVVGAGSSNIVSAPAIASTTSSATSRRSLCGVYSTASVLRHLVCRFRYRWRKQTAEWCCSTSARRPRFGYDPVSYSQNFDDGFYND